MASSKGKKNEQEQGKMPIMIAESQLIPSFVLNKEQRKNQDKRIYFN